jgi:hypothetical protein
MPPIRIYVMRPLGPAGPWHVSVNGSEGESFKDEESAVRAARDTACELGREVRSSKFAKQRRVGNGSRCGPENRKVLVRRPVFLSRAVPRAGFTAPFASG